MTLAKRAAIAGSISLIVVGLAFSVVYFLGDRSPAVYLLAPGAMVGFAVLSGRVHEVSFVVIGFVTNLIVYGVLAERVMWLWAKRVRAAHKTNVITAGGVQG